MLSDSVREQAQAAINARFKLRDDVLRKELEQLAARSVDPSDAEEVSKLGIRLRLICEHDLFERAFIVWNNIKKAHEECGALKATGLMADFKAESRRYMQEASLNLAAGLKDHSAALAPAFSGRSGISAEWLASLRNRASEKYGKDMEEYIEGLSYGLRSMIQNIRS